MKLQKKDWYLLAILFLLNLPVSAGCKKNGASGRAQNGRGLFKTVGYLMINKSNLLQAAAQIDFSRLTHLNLAFVNPDSSGAFADNPVLPQIVQLGHDHQVKVLLSLGGGSMPAWVTNLLSDNRRQAFINAIMAVVAKNGFDGVDVDLEGSNIDVHYGVFVAELSTELTAQKRLLTAAVATWNGAVIPDEALTRYDFINIMSYDKTGPWNPSVAGQHSPYDMAVSDLAYWGNKRGVPKERMTLGVPFYGYGFGANGKTSTMIYGDIISAFPGAENKDQLSLPDGETMYYNGIPTIKSKTSLALKEAGGIMIWELLQDGQGANSLLNNINDVITNK
jgi:GH18 family chitinase